MSDASLIRAVRAWVEIVVVGENFCPFARSVLEGERLRQVVANAADSEAVLQALVAECRYLDAHPETETTLLLIPQGFDDFDTFLDLTALADDLLERQGYAGTYQIAHFHPHYRFADSLPDDPADYTNRAPVPTLHLLREASLTRAVDAHPDPQGIPHRNVEHARRLGLEQLRALFERCREGGQTD